MWYPQRLDEFLNTFLYFYGKIFIESFILIGALFLVK